MSDGRKNNGGARKGAGRPKKVDEEQKNFIFSEGIKKFTGKECDTEAKIELVSQLLETPRGQIWVAESVFGKPEQSMDLKIDDSQVQIKRIEWVENGGTDK